MDQRLQELTSQTIKEILHLEIVLPEIYRDIFNTKAEELGIAINEFDKESALMYALQKIQYLKDEAQSSATTLKATVINAKEAISNRDNEALTMIETDIAELEKKIASLEQELYTDELTRLYNRRWLFETYLQNEHFYKAGVLAFIDINNFKHVNDQYGHLIGDKVLHVVGKLLHKIKFAKAIRFAGDEFIIISHESNEEEMEKLLHNVNTNLRKTPFKHQEEHFYLDFSFGVVTFQTNDNFKEILNNADEKMYLYKKSRK